jgi:hypothetical protein
VTCVFHSPAAKNLPTKNLQAAKLSFRNEAEIDIPRQTEAERIYVPQTYPQTNTKQSSSN